MADIGRVSQSVVLVAALENSTARISQSFILAAVGLGVTCNNPPNAMRGVPYSHTIVSGGGEPPVTFALTAGSLPPGLSLDTSTGIISGVATVFGVYPFTIQVTDALSAVASVACSIAVTAAVAILIQLIGWKLYPVSPCEEPAEVPELPHVERAM